MDAVALNDLQVCLLFVLLSSQLDSSYVIDLYYDLEEYFLVVLSYLCTRIRRLNFCVHHIQLRP